MPVKLFYQVRGHKTCLKKCKKTKQTLKTMMNLLFRFHICTWIHFLVLEKVSPRRKIQKHCGVFATERTVKILPLERNSNCKMSKTIARLFVSSGLQIPFPGQKFNFEIMTSSFCNIKMFSEEWLLK